MSSARAVVLIAGACIGLNAWLAFLAWTRAHPLASVVFALYLVATTVVLVGLASGGRRRFAFRAASSVPLSLRCGDCGGSVVYRDIRRGPFERLVLPLLTLHPYCCLNCDFRPYLRVSTNLKNSIA